VPGNHDVYVRGMNGLCRSYWGDYMRGDDGNAHDQLDFPFVRRRGPVALIGLSSAVPSAPFMATGRLGSAQVDRLAALLKRCGDEGRFRVVLIHHPPRSSPRRHFKRLIDAANLRTALQLHGAELVLHGHDHVRSLIHLDGPQHWIPAAGVPSASQVPHGEHGPAGYNLYRIAGEPGSWRCEMIMRALSPDGEMVEEVDRRALY
jgi:3',5'-cyclic AMP phosphodiesterase CpdA